MHDKTLLKIALIGSVLGVALIFLISERTDLDEHLISQLDEMPEGKEVRITGLVLRASDADKVMFLQIAQEKIEEVTVVLFKDGKVDVKEGDVVTIVGSIEEYQGKKEIVGNRVEIK